jgi:hypothetical protein
MLPRVSLALWRPTMRLQVKTQCSTSRYYRTSSVAEVMAMIVTIAVTESAFE